MKIELQILNTEINSGPNSKPQATWHSRMKSYESDWMDQDIIDAPRGLRLEGLTITYATVRSKSDVEALIELLENAKPCFDY